MNKIFSIIIMFFLLSIAPKVFAQGQDADVYKKLLSLHRVKTPPGPYDWLARHHEEGQTVEDYMASNPIRPDNKRKVIAILLLGDFDETRREIIQKTVQYIEGFYGLPVRFEKDIPLSSIPSKARRVHPQTKDKQILTSYVIEEVLIPRLPDDAVCLIAFTSSDLWPGAGWNFVFGQASIDDRVGVWSIYRNGDPQGSKEAYQLCLKRTIKTGVHEISHMFSLHHCIYYECLVNGSNHRSEADSRPLWLCPVCLRKLAWGLKWDLKARYKKLYELCERFGFNAEAEFFKRSIKAIEQ